MNFFLLLYLLAVSPKLLFERAFKGKRHPSFLQRLGIFPPTSHKKRTIWIHAVSVGEVKATRPLLLALREQYPDHFFLITTTTATGMSEAKRSLPEAFHAYSPLDFSWSVQRYIQNLHPTLFLCVESDFWPNLLKALKKNGVKTALVSGKLSARSAKRFHLFPRFAKKFFSYFDIICVQNQEYKERFLPFFPTPHITGNLKFDQEPQTFQPFPGHEKIPNPAIVISCTHAPEEEEILKALQGLDLFLILAPRHPERFLEVAELLTQKNIPFVRWTKLDQYEGSPVRVLLVDLMGQLPLCYKLGRLAILGGSFAPIGGHNLLEPCLYDLPVFFGPHTFAQTELTKHLIQSGAGHQLSLAELRPATLAFFQNPAHEYAMKMAAQKLVQNLRGVTKRTLKIVLEK